MTEAGDALNYSVLFFWASGKRNAVAIAHPPLLLYYLALGCGILLFGDYKIG